jgi:hypothetical protein
LRHWRERRKERKRYIKEKEKQKTEKKIKGIRERGREER